MPFIAGKVEAIREDLGKVGSVLARQVGEAMLERRYDERGQQELDMASLRHRADAIPGEIERETEAIRRRCAGPTPRLFPVAVTWLVPEKGAR